MQHVLLIFNDDEIDLGTVEDLLNSELCDSEVARQLYHVVQDIVNEMIDEDDGEEPQSFVIELR